MEIHFDIPGVKISRTQFKRENPVRTVDRITYVTEDFEYDIIFDATIAPKNVPLWDILPPRAKAVWILCFLVFASWDDLLTKDENHEIVLKVRKDRGDETYDLMLISYDPKTKCRLDALSVVVEITAFDDEAQDWLRSHRI